MQLTNKNDFFLLDYDHFLDLGLVHQTIGRMNRLN